MTLAKNSRWVVIKKINAYIVEAQCACGHIEHPQIWDLEHDYLMCDLCTRNYNSQGLRKRRELIPEDLQNTEWTLIESHIRKDVYGHWYSKVRCSCGNEQDILNLNLKNGRSMMCKQCATAQRND